MQQSRRWDPHPNHATFGCLLDHFLDQLLEVSAKMREAGIEVANVGTGSTPCCSHSGAEAMKQLTEIHPGNYVLYDTQQMAVGTYTDNM